MDLNKVKQELERFNTGSDRPKQGDDGKIFKPQNGEQIIRIIPNIHQPDIPFVKLYWHYNLKGKHYVSPFSFGEPDPFVEFANELLKKNTKEDFALAQKLQPKLRIYAPILVRGMEKEGPKYWGFSKTLYNEILGFINDPDYGDITDPKNGRDITLEKIPAEETEYSYPTYKVRVKPAQTSMTDDQEVVEKVKNLDKIRDIFYVPDYNKLKTVLQEWIEENKKEESSNTGSEDVQNKEKQSVKKSQQQESDGDMFSGLGSSQTQEESKKPAKESEKTEEKDGKESDDVKDGKSMLDQFNEMF